MKKRFLLSWLFFILLTAYGYAQSVQLKGKITGKDNVPLSGVDVIIKGSTKGTVTDSTGEFSLSVPANAILVISHIGYKSKVVPVSGQAFIAESLEQENQELENVVVIGYQTASRKSVTTSISSVNAKEIKSYVTGNVANAIQGKIPGVQVLPGNGLPGSQPTILIRGLSSLTGNTKPLVIVDGNEIGYNDLNFINPSDIENIDVLKDASASAIYGSRAGQGVILITTKRGKGKPSINIESSVGIDQVPGNIKLADATEYARIMNRVAQNSGSSPTFADPSNVPNTDYWSRTFDNGMRQNHVLSATGGKEGLQLYGSIGYYKQNSYYATDKGGDWEKITARFNADMTLSKVVKVGLNFAPRYEKWLSSNSGVLKTAYAMDPTTLPFKTVDSVNNAVKNDVTWNYTAFNPYYSLPNRSPFNGINSPDLAFRTNFFQNDAFGAQYGAYVEVKPIENLVLKTSIEGFATSINADYYYPKYYLATNSNNRVDSLSSANEQNMRWKWTNTANYKFSVQKHNIDVLAGMSADNYIVKGVNTTKKGIPFDEEPYRNVGAATDVVRSGGYRQPGAAPFGKMTSYFGSIRYNFDEKYYVSATMRADASSLVNPLYKWGYFPTLSGAWVISQESFFQPLASTVNYLKLRAGWGRAGGNLPSAVGSYLSTVGPITYPDGSGGYINGYYPNNIANPEIKWEIQEDYTVGVDATLLQNKLDLTFETYVRKPKNLLLNVNVDPVLGYPQGYIPVQPANIGKLTTKGWDLALGYKDEIAKKFRYGVNLTVSHFKSITDYAGNGDPVRYGVNNDVITTWRSRITKGHEPGAWYGYIVDGVFQTDAEATGYVNKNGQVYQPLAKAGDLRFHDINDDGKIDNNDLTDIGSPWPKLTTGLTLTLNYGNFDLRAELYGSWGAEYNNNYRLLMQGAGHYNFLQGLGDQFWHGEGTSNSFPILKTTDPNGNFSKMSTFLIEKANFVRARMIQLGYTLPQVKGLKNVRLYISAQNLFTITNYSGLNPDLPYQGIGFNGMDDFQPVQPKSYLFGVSVAL